MPGASFSNNTSTGSVSWTSPQNAQASDGVFTTATVVLGVLSSAHTNYLTATGFGFSLPSNVTICGVTVTVVRQWQGTLQVGANMYDNSVKLITGGTIGGIEHASGTTWSSSVSTVQYGGASDEWGLALTPAIVNSPNFGVAISTYMSAGLVSLTSIAAIDYISVNITYTNPLLPINLESFSATRQNKATVLNWTASCSSEGNQFVVQRCGDSQNWQNLTAIPAAPLRQQYSYTDFNPLDGANQYRLFLGNQDARGVYSPIQVIGQQVIAVRCYPNPFTDVINISGPSLIHAIALKDLQGRTLLSKTMGTTTNRVQLPASGLPPGLYLVQVDGAVFKVTKQYQ